MASFLMAPIFAFQPVGNGDDNYVGATDSGIDHWGMAETFWNVSTGTDAPASFGDMILIPQANTDSVVLDGWLWEMTKTSMVGTVARFSPSNPATRTNDWNISTEITRPREDSAYLSSAISAQAGNQSLIIYLTDQSGFILAGVSLTTGSYLGESIRIYDASSAVWLQVADDIRPAFPHDFENYGFRPDRYVVSFAHVSTSSEVEIAVRNTATGVVFVGGFTLPKLGGIDNPQLRFDIDSAVGEVASYDIAGGWIIDNLMFRSAESMYPTIEPVYEVVAKQDPLWLDIRDVDGKPIRDAHVSIDGISAAYDTDNERYEAYLDRAVDWDAPIPYSILVDGVLINDILKVSTAPNPVNKVSLPRWWNGWDWVTVIGKDDSSSPLSAPQMFSAYNHPKTSYISTNFSGSSTSLLETQSEIAIHCPHDYKYWGQKFWDEAVASSDAGHAIFEDSYWFASRWDDPRYVGKGDMYISLANPGNSGSWEQMFAEYAMGTRVMGICSQYYLAGNSSLIGSYWMYAPDAAIPGWASWHPNSKMDMMDMFRGLNIDNTNPHEWILSRSVAQAGGVLRIYNHKTISDPVYMRWLCNDKTNLSYENWKATDGEVASYVYGSRSTEVLYNSSSTNDTWIYDVSKRSPFAAGYWNVPVTIAIDISGKKILDVEVRSGPWTLKMSDESLRDLQGNRTMDVGFDIRGNTLYVSHFWNSSSSLILSVESLSHTVRNPILISGNFGFNLDNGVVSGEGTLDDPYIIEDWVINASMAAGAAGGIQISHTDAHFKIRNVRVELGGALYTGIWLSNVRNASVEDSVLVDNYEGISLNSTASLTIRNNTLINNSFSGVYAGASEYVSIELNEITGSRYGVYSDSCEQVQIVDNAISDNEYGVYMDCTSNSSISGNDIARNQYGIYLTECNDIEMSDNSLVDNDVPVYDSGNLVDDEVDRLVVPIVLIAASAVAAIVVCVAVVVLLRRRKRLR